MSADESQERVSWLSWADNAMIIERGHLVKKKDLLEYSLQIAMLNQLKNKKMINDKEYNMILKRLKSDYGVVSNICC